MIILVDSNNKTNFVHWLAIQYKKMTKSVLTFELYAILHEFDIGVVLKLIMKCVLVQFMPMIFYTDSKSLYNCMVKQDTTQEKRLIVNIICLQWSFQRHKIIKIKWINNNSNSANAMIKAKPCYTFQELINTNTIKMKTLGPVKWDMG